MATKKEDKKYIATSVIIDGDKKFQPDEEVSFNKEQTDRLLELGAIKEAE